MSIVRSGPLSALTSHSPHPASSSSVPHTTSNDDEFFKRITLELVACPFSHKRKELLRIAVTAGPTPLSIAQITHLLPLLNFAEERLILLECFLRTVDESTTTHAQLETKLLPHFLFYTERQKAKEIIAGDIL
jgi:hypothetical protein